MFGLTFDKLIILGLIAAVILGPQRLPEAAEWLAHAIKRVKAFGTDLRERVADEMGPEFDDVDWRSLDPRQYDPRQIVRNALIEPAPALPSRVPRPGLAPNAGPPAPTPAVTATNEQDVA